jgi:probable phosphoglycerate mutase
MARHFVITADGGARSNPVGPAAYGAVVYENNEVVKELGASIGVASNNVAEYSGLIAGLKAVNEIDPTATILVKMDSKLVIEQMSGRWKVKHPNMQKLVKEAFTCHDPKLVSYQWIPREENSHADSILNDVLDSGM